MSELESILNYLETTSMEPHDDYTSEFSYKEQKVLWKYIKQLQQENEELKKQLSNDHQIKMKRLQQENRELKQQLDCSLGVLSENCPPCEKDGFMDKYSDYCERNCGVDEEIFKKCWLMYIKDKVSEVE